MLNFPRLLTLGLFFAPCLSVLTGCESIKDHISLGAIELQFEHLDMATNALEKLTPPDIQRSGPILFAHQTKEAATSVFSAKISTR